MLIYQFLGVINTCSLLLSICSDSGFIHSLSSVEVIHGFGIVLGEFCSDTSIFR